MTSKSGRLTFSGRNDYIIVPVYGLVNAINANGHFGARVTGYAARCTCMLGDHYLAYDPVTHQVSERTSDRGAVPDACILPTYDDALAAIEAWQRQHAAAQATSGETEQEG